MDSAGGLVRRVMRGVVPRVLRARVARWIVRPLVGGEARRVTDVRTMGGIVPPLTGGWR